MKKKKYKKEKYISEKQNKKGISFQICIPYSDGEKRKYYTETIKSWDFPSDKAAFDFAKKRRDLTLVNLPSGKKEKTVPTVAELYERLHVLSGVSLGTRKRNDVLFKSSLEKFGCISLSEIKTSDIQETLVEYASCHSQTQVNRLTSLWRKLYETAQIDEYDIVNKALAVNRPKGRKIVPKRSTVTTKDDFDVFCSALLSYSDKETYLMYYYILQIMYWTGMRPAEVFALSAEDINLEKKFISVSKSVGSDSESFRVIIIAKTPDSVRRIPIVPELESILENVLRRYSSSPLFCASDGLPIDVKIFSHDISMVSDSCGIPFNAYRLRHLFSTDLFGLNTNPIVIKDLMGHASVKMSADYANSSESDRTSALKNRKN